MVELVTLVFMPSGSARGRSNTQRNLEAKEDPKIVCLCRPELEPKQI